MLLRCAEIRIKKCAVALAMADLDAPCVLAFLDHLAGDGIEGLSLGGTELPLILRADEYAGVQFLDTTKLHAEAIVSRLLS